MRVAIIQFNSGSDKRRNLTRALAMTEKAAADAQLIVLPEAFLFRGPDKSIPDVAEEISGAAVLSFMNLARERKVGIILGSVHERDLKKRKIYNTAVFLDQQGRIVGRYRKMNLFKATLGNKHIDEGEIISPGDSGVVVDFLGFKIGLSICYDLRFPELYWQYGRKGCDVLAIPSAFTYKTGQFHWEVLLRARAIENLCYVIAPNQVGRQGQGVKAFGHSMVVDPWGQILVKALGAKERILKVDIDRNHVVARRKCLPGIYMNNLK